MEKKRDWGGGGEKGGCFFFFFSDYFDSRDENRFCKYSQILLGGDSVTSDSSGCGIGGETGCVSIMDCSLPVDLDRSFSIYSRMVGIQCGR